MKSLILALSLAVASAGFAPLSAEARRLGGGGSSGMQRSLPARTPPPALPARPAQQAAPAAPAGVPTAAAAAAPRRSWLGPIAGLAAGLGIAALMSHMGLGPAMGQFLMLALLALVAFMVIRFLMRRFGATGGARMASANGMRFDRQAPVGAPAGPVTANPAMAGTPSAAAATAAMPSGPVASGATAPPTAYVTRLPAGFDAAGFERIAKTIFIRLQTANDRADLADLRAFTTPELFAAIRLDLQQRGDAAQTTDVVRVDTEVLDVATEAERQIVSVRFHGLIREKAEGPTEPFDEIWHLVRPIDGSREWAIAGIQQAAAA